ncbi:porin family protein [Pedobacter sp. ASV28]|uniref:porin family protein n=1 Tax=Pedobacter sp. ASV28 TaxID=2795123 RepID=UPI0018EDE635|nr:porin family protein [Pedobacter sp. ASV28]
MKSKIFSFLLLLSLNSFSQEKTKLKIGLKLGINFSAFTNKAQMLTTFDAMGYNDFESYFRGSIAVGLVGEYNLSNRLNVGTELLYNSRGNAYRRENNSVLSLNSNGGRQQAYDYYIFKLDYLELPIMINYKFLNGSSTYLSAYGGVAPGILVSSNVSLKYPTITSGPGNGQPNRDQSLHGVNKLNISPLIGVQVGSQQLGKTTFYLDLRGSYGIVPVFKNNIGFDTRMVTGTFGLGLKF